MKAPIATTSKTQSPSSSSLSRFSPDVVTLTEEVYGEDAQAVLEALRKPVQTYYVRCNTIKISPEDLRGRLQGKGFRVSQHPVLPEALGIAVEGPFEISPAERQIVVDKHTAESVLQGANVYAPGIVDCEAVRFGDLVTVTSEMGDVLGAGTAVMSCNDILTFRKGLAVKVENRRYKSPQIRDLPEYSEGLLYPQSLAAMATSRALNPQGGETILDMNCAPGGKLSHISQLMHNSGRIVGLDRNGQKIATTRERISALGCSNVTVSIQDSRYADVDLQDLKPDRVIVDPPCSALGLRPKVYDQTTKRRVRNLSEYQKQFMKAASKVVKPHGVVVYSVCTYTANECEGVVEFAQRECGLHLVEQNPIVASKNFHYGSSLTQRFDPGLDEIGYFIAKFER